METVKPKSTALSPGVQTLRLRTSSCRSASSAGSPSQLSRRAPVRCLLSADRPFRNQSTSWSSSQFGPTTFASDARTRSASLRSAVTTTAPRWAWAMATIVSSPSAGACTTSTPSTSLSSAPARAPPSSTSFTGGSSRPEVTVARTRSVKRRAAPTRSRHQPVGRDPITLAASITSIPRASRQPALAGGPSHALTGPDRGPSPSAPDGLLRLRKRTRRPKTLPGTQPASRSRRNHLAGRTPRHRTARAPTSRTEDPLGSAPPRPERDDTQNDEPDGGPLHGRPDVAWHGKRPAVRIPLAPPEGSSSSERFCRSPRRGRHVGAARSGVTPGARPPPAGCAPR